MGETIQYDDDPALTAAENWLRTALGETTVQRAKESPSEMLLRAFRTGYIIGQKAAEAVAAVNGGTEVDDLFALEPGWERMR